MIIAHDGKSILCTKCHLRSYNANDVVHKFCGSCHTYAQTTTVGPDPTKGVDLSNQLNPTLAVDIVVYCDVTDLSIWKNWEKSPNRGEAPKQGGTHVLVVGRSAEAYVSSEGFVCLPGGFVDYGESPEQAAVREAFEEVHLELKISGLTLIGVYGDPQRDPRAHVVSVAYQTWAEQHQAATSFGDDDVKWVQWVHVNDLHKFKFGFDHAKIISESKKWIS